MFGSTERRKVKNVWRQRFANFLCEFRFKGWTECRDKLETLHCLKADADEADEDTTYLMETWPDLQKDKYTYKDKGKHA